MSLTIQNYIAHNVSAKPRTIPRIFTVSPALYGATTINLDQAQKINASSSGQWTITPQSTFTASVKMWGAGGSGNNYSGLIATGASAGFSSGSVQFQAGVTYQLIVGEGGTVVTGTSGPRTFGGGGYAVDNGWANKARGGGLSGVFQTSYTQANAILVAGGGGAAEIGNNTPGAGGGASGLDANANASGNGFGGTQAAGGGANNGGGGGGSAGVALLGGNGGGGAGGGGYFGGGGGTWAGGGGSGYVKGTVINGASVAGTLATPAKSTDTDRGGAGQGGNNLTAGTNGRVVIS